MKYLVSALGLVGIIATGCAGMGGYVGPTETHNDSLTGKAYQVIRRVGLTNSTSSGLFSSELGLGSLSNYGSNTLMFDTKYQGSSGCHDRTLRMLIEGQQVNTDATGIPDFNVFVSGRASLTVTATPFRLTPEETQRLLSATQWRISICGIGGDVPREGLNAIRALFGIAPIPQTEAERKNDALSL
jgi:hypothetical protein